MPAIGRLVKFGGYNVGNVQLAYSDPMVYTKGEGHIIELHCMLLPVMGLWIFLCRKLLMEGRFYHSRIVIFYKV